MATDKADGAATESLVSRIKHCIVEADVHGLHVVAAHLDAALNALQGTGLEPPDLAGPPYSSLH